VFNLGIWSLRS